MLSKFTRPNSLLLVAILIIAAILRLWKFNDLSLMHDELSALSRLDYDSFEDFMFYGIQVDGHPAGIQLFLYYFTSLFGRETLVIKLPFIATGIASIYLAFQLGKKWFSESTGLLTASLLAGIQYTIIYSDIIRPYSPGLFICLLMTNYWSDIFILKKTSWGKFIGFGLTIAATAYIHYFALLFALIVSLTGLCLINKKIAVKYISAGVLALVLYTPHLNIFFYQLNVGGVGIGQGGWLKAPDSQFLFNYFAYLFNYSSIFLSIAAVLFFSTVFSFKNNKAGIPKRFILLIWFITPIAIGFWYSTKINPVLQFSVLLFSTPFIFIFLTGFDSENRFITNLISSTIIIAISIYSLNNNRQHYTSFHKQPVGSFYDIVKANHNDSTLLIGSHENGFINHYNQINNEAYEYYTTDEDCTTVAQFQELLKDPQYNQVILGTVSPKNLGMTQLYFPNCTKHEIGINLENAVFKKGTLDTSLYYKDYKLGSSNWINKNKKLKQTDEGFILKSKWGISRSFSLDTLIDNEHDIIEFYADIQTLVPDSSRSFLLVLEFKKNEEKVKWSGFSSEKATNPENENFKIVNAQQIFGNDGEKPNSVKAYIWNKNKTKLLIKQIGLRVRKGNPNKYALFNRLQY